MRSARRRQPRHPPSQSLRPLIPRRHRQPEPANPRAQGRTNHRRSLRRRLLGLPRRHQGYGNGDLQGPRSWDRRGHLNLPRSSWQHRQLRTHGHARRPDRYLHLRSQCRRSLRSRFDDPRLHPGQPAFGLRHAGRRRQTNLPARLRQPLRDRRRDLPEVPAGFHQGRRHFARGQYPVGYVREGRC